MVVSVSATKERRDATKSDVVRGFLGKIRDVNSQ